jgi:hypothetical protein
MLIDKRRNNQHKKEIIMNRSIIVMALLLIPISLMADAQNITTPASPDRVGNVPPAPLIFTALDANHDKIISADEIAKSAAALKTLDKNADSKLTPDEYKPPRPGGSGKPEGLRGPSGSPKPSASSSPAGEGPRPPKPPIDLVLDANQDDIISASEIANAQTALKTLDKNNDGRLTPDECLPIRPTMPANNQKKG